MKLDMNQVVKKVWYPAGARCNRIGFIRDVYGTFVEVEDEEDGSWHIVPYAQTSPVKEPIVKTENNYIQL